MNHKRIATLVSAVAVLYTGIPMLVNASGATPWIALPPALTFAVYEAAALACAALGVRSRATGKHLLSVASFAATVAWMFLIYVTLTYCPGGTAK